MSIQLQDVVKDVVKLLLHKGCLRRLLSLLLRHLVNCPDLFLVFLFPLGFILLLNGIGNISALYVVYAVHKLGRITIFFRGLHDLTVGRHAYACAFVIPEERFISFCLSPYSIGGFTDIAHKELRPLLGLLSLGLCSLYYGVSLIAGSLNYTVTLCFYVRLFLLCAGNDLILLYLCGTKDAVSCRLCIRKCVDYRVIAALVLRYLCIKFLYFFFLLLQCCLKFFFAEHTLYLRN